VLLVIPVYVIVDTMAINAKFHSAMELQQIALKSVPLEMVLAYQGTIASVM